MNNEDPKGELYRELLSETRESLKVVKELMKSEDEGIRLNAVQYFIILTEMAVGLADILGETPEPENREDRNPLARRTRLDR